MSGASKPKKNSKSKKEKKSEYFDKVVKLLSEYRKILLVTCDNIGSNHMQRIRRTMRGKAVLLMGKNTMMRKAIRMNLASNSKWEALLPHITYNVGMIFTNTDLQQIKKIIDESRVPAPAKIGAVAPNDVIIPKGITTLEPTKTGFLQALNIASKINKGSIEILQDVHLIKENDKVGSSEATLLQMLDIRPFEYGLKITSIYDDGAVYSVKVLMMTDDDIMARFCDGLKNVASLSLGLHYPTLASFPHAFLNAYKNLLAIAVGTSYEFKEAEAVKKYLENPGAFAITTSSATNVSSAPAKADKAPEPAAVEEKEESEGMDFDIFS